MSSGLCVPTAAPSIGRYANRVSKTKVCMHGRKGVKLPGALTHTFTQIAEVPKVLVSQCG